MHSGNGNKISLPEAIAYVIGDIIGSGIFVSPTSILKHSGSLGLSLIIWSVGAIISIIGALVYVELGTKIRKSGCDFAYLSHVQWNPFASAFLFVATTLTYPSILAIQTMAFGEYFVKGLNDAFNMDMKTEQAAIPRLIGFAALLPLTFINLFSLKKFAGRFQIIVTVVKLFVIAIIIGTGFWFLAIKGKTQNFHNSFENTTKNPDDVVLALYNGLFAYNGFDILNFGMEEIENPRRTLPIAAFAGIGIAAVVYISMNLAYFSMLTVEQFKHSDTVAVDFAAATLGSFHYAFPFLIAILLLGSMNSTIFGSSRYLFAGAKRGIMPGALKCAHPSSMSPRAAVIVEMCVAICISFIGNLEQLLNYMTYAIWMQRTVVQVALLYMRYKKFPIPKDSIENPIFIPILFLCICIALLVIPVKNASYSFFWCFKTYFEEWKKQNRLKNKLPSNTYFFQDYQVGIYGVAFVIAGFIIYFIFIFPKKLPQFLINFNGLFVFSHSIFGILVVFFAERLIIGTQIALNTMPIEDESIVPSNAIIPNNNNIDDSNSSNSNNNVVNRRTLSLKTE